ncbi:bifunctional hydroxylase/dehydrase [Actinacidiphila yanglinensis]|uniref:Bifunctional hydroxylase/dehydrase n=1 Tax=Actinacidiphila yanglinensis TaxID=310779 RepID=A0A1H6DQ43_9ACTN|nr:FAD-dependent monooxygenase [Actinacidiphila yanglinensis]SEG87429.1 bifunctional hydroxylase/dehydrase [Actinacidiphila yanglinensis]
MDAAVIVVGAGPTGLMAAGELRLAGVDVVVLDRLPRPSGESRGLGFTPRTMEVFDQRGLLPRYGPLDTSPLGHFGGVPVDFGVLDGAHFSVRGVPQHRTEAVLGGWIEELGARVLRGTDVVGLSAGTDEVTVTVEGPDGPGTLRAGWVVGCDGGRSTVRKLAGFSFEGTESTMEMFLADIADCDIAPRPIGESLPGGMAMSVPIGDGVHRIIVCERGARPRPRPDGIRYGEVASAWRRLTGQDISAATPLWISAFGDAARQADAYRRGRVLLAGDAAHIHLPAGGQGMNTGVQDAVNLGWKLAAVVRGHAPQSLLDTYHDERHPVGRRLLANTRAQGLLYLSGSEVQPLRDVLGELVVHHAVGRHLAGMVSGLDIRYDVGPGTHPLLGRRLPHAELSTGGGRSDTTSLLRPARGVLLDLADDPVLRRRAAAWTDRLTIVTGTPLRGSPASGAGGPLAGTKAVLVRPDGHVAWTAPGTDLLLDEALTRWFGPSLRRTPAPARSAA